VSAIEWTQQTWNPIAGCSKVSPGCANCYAEVMAGRLARMGQTKYHGLTVLQGKHARWTGKIAFDDRVLLKPLQTKKPTTWFVNSMSDLFHENVTDEQIDLVFAVMALCSRHTFQVLTKRPERMKAYFELKRPRGMSHLACDLTPWYVWRAANVMQVGLSGQTIFPIGWDYENKDLHDDIRSFSGWPMPNVWLGVSVENQETAEERIPLLLETRAALRFISAEPLLDDLDLTVLNRKPSDFDRSMAGFENCMAFYRDSLSGYNGVLMMDGKCHEERIGAQPKLDWVIVGGESGYGSRPCNVEWIRSIVEQCVEAGVPCFVKQLGMKPFIGNPRNRLKQLDRKKGGWMESWPEDLRVRRMPEVSR
jgi:protein gp37